MPASAEGARAALMIMRSRAPLRIAVPSVTVMAVVVPLLVGLYAVSVGGALAVLVLAGAIRSIDSIDGSFKWYLHALNGIVLTLVAYAVLVMGIAPVITVYFPVLMLLATAYTVGAQPAIFWAIPSFVLVGVAVVASLPEAREAGTIPTLLIRLGTVLCVLTFAVYTRKAHDRQSHELERLATTDALTGLANRIEFDRAMAQALARTARAGHTGALVFVDLDGMKAINDTFGHGLGDVYLCEIAERIRSVTRAVDTPARLGGDEFVILLPEVNSAIGGEVYAEKLMSVISVRWEVMGTEILPSASIGVATFSGADDTADELLRNADLAMYEAKRAGGRRIVHVGDRRS